MRSNTSSNGIDHWAITGADQSKVQETTFSQSLADYALSENLYSSDRTQIYRAIHRPNQRSVILKFLSNPNPPTQELVRFRKQYTLTHPLDHANILKIEALVTYQNGDVLVMTDQGYSSLKDYLKDHPVGSPLGLSLLQVLTISIQLADVLHYLRQQRIIHKDIKPGNILIHPDTLHIQLIDFGLAASIPPDRRDIDTPKRLEGTLAYMAPEQTGRMNRGIDGRADLYSVGVVLYELLTGQCPFLATDTLELIYAHLAETPIPPSQHSSSVPSVVSDIVLKLLAKNAEDRYQSGLGLKRDLEACLEQWQRMGEPQPEHSHFMQLQPFDLGRWDVPDRVVMPNCLYGREAEVRSLLDSFEQVATGQTQLTLVAGPSGMGKTALIQALYPAIAHRNGWLIQGKFDQVNRNIPFSAFIQACQSLVVQLQSEPDEVLATWRQQLLDVLGNVGQVMIDVVPELEQIIGPQPAVPKLSGEANRNRFNQVVSRFIQLFAVSEHPLVLFLDDLQWVDDASLKLLQTLIIKGGKQTALLVLGAYRDNEVSADHPLTPLLDPLNDILAKGQMKTLTVCPLAVETVSQLLADLLMCPVDQAEPLAQWVNYKTNGNPFFVSRFVKGLEAEGCFRFDRDAGYWRFSLNQVGELALDEDSTGFVIAQLKKLPQPTQQALTLAAFLGNRFDLAVLSIVTKTNALQLKTDLWPALQAGFLLLNSGSERSSQRETAETDEKADQETLDSDHDIKYQFVHDQIQQAAYGLTPSEQHPYTHYQIGRSLQESELNEHSPGDFFAMVNHLNMGVDYIAAYEYQELIQLNLEACRKAQRNTAYQSALAYAKVAQSLMKQNAWDESYELTLEIYNIVAELNLLIGDYEAMDNAINALLAHGKSLLDKIQAYSIKIQSKYFQNKFETAIAIGIDTLQKLGISISLQPTQDEVDKFLKQTYQNIQLICISDLLKLATMKSSEQLAIVKIASQIISPAFVFNPALFLIIVSLLVELSIHHGNSVYSAFTYGCYGLILCNLFKEIETGVKFGQLAAALDKKTVTQALKGRGIIMLGLWLEYRQSHLRNTLELLLTGYKMSLEVGDLEFVGHSSHVYSLNAFWSGFQLSQLYQDAEYFRLTLAEMNEPVAERYLSFLCQACADLLAIDGPLWVLNGKGVDEAIWMEQYQNDTGRFFYNLYKTVVYFILERSSLALTHISNADENRHDVKVLIFEAEYYFYDSLVRLATINSDHQDEYLEKVVKNQSQLQDYWANYAPMNFQHKVDLVEAEKCRVVGDKANAMELYDKAIAGANANDYIQEAALANELAAKFYLGWGKEKIAAIYMQEAHRCYAQWGAKAKTTDLEHRYPHLLPDGINQTSAVAPAFPSPSITHPSATLSSYASTMWGLHASDFAPIMKSAQVLVDINDTSTLIRQLIQLALISSGAQTCIVAYQDEAGQCKLQSNRITDSPDQRSQSYPNHLIQWTKNTRVTTILDGQSPLGIIDPYLLEHQPQSAFCVPILKEETVLGVLYLEHRQAKAMFTQRDQTILSFLCAQAAIALDNALLHHSTQTIPNPQTSFTTLLQTIPQMAWLEDPNGHILATNPAFAQTFGQNNPDNLIGQSLPQWAPPQLMEQLQAQDIPSPEQSNVSHVELADDHGEPQCYDVVRTAIQDSDGTLTGVMGIWLGMGLPSDQGQPHPILEMEKSPRLDASPNLAEHQEDDSPSVDDLFQLMVSKVTNETTSAVEQVKVALIELLPQGVCSMAAVAKHIDMSDRTLRRRLKDEGTTFKDELAQLRLAFAKHYLTQSALTSQEIAGLLGYDKPGSFSRAFSATTGLKPQEFRDTYRSP